MAVADGGDVSMISEREGTKSKDDRVGECVLLVEGEARSSWE
jgi:hypothetical protein